MVGTSDGFGAVAVLVVVSLVAVSGLVTVAAALFAYCSLPLGGWRLLFCSELVMRLMLKISTVSLLSLLGTSCRRCSP